MNTLRLLQTLDLLDTLTQSHAAEIHALSSKLRATEQNLRDVETDRDELRDVVTLLVEKVELENGCFKGWPYAKIRVTGGYADPLPRHELPIEPTQESYAHASSIIRLLRSSLDDERKAHKKTREVVASLGARLARREAELVRLCERTEREQVKEATMDRLLDLEVRELKTEMDDSYSGPKVKRLLTPTPPGNPEEQPTLRSPLRLHPKSSSLESPVSGNVGQTIHRHDPFSSPPEPSSSPPSSSFTRSNKRTSRSRHSRESSAQGHKVIKVNSPASTSTPHSSKMRRGMPRPVFSLSSLEDARVQETPPRHPRSRSQGHAQERPARPMSYPPPKETPIAGPSSSSSPHHYETEPLSLSQSRYPTPSPSAPLNPIWNSSARTPERSIPIPNPDYTYTPSPAWTSTSRSPATAQAYQLSHQLGRRYFPSPGVSDADYWPSSSSWTEDVGDWEYDGQYYNIAPVDDDGGYDDDATSVDDGGGYTDIDETEGVQSELVTYGGTEEMFYDEDTSPMSTLTPTPTRTMTMTITPDRSRRHYGTHGQAGRVFIPPPTPTPNSQYSTQNTRIVEQGTPEATASHHQGSPSRKNSRSHNTASFGTASTSTYWMTQSSPSPSPSPSASKGGSSSRLSLSFRHPKQPSFTKSYSPNNNMSNPSQNAENHRTKLFPISPTTAADDLSLSRRHSRKRLSTGSAASLTATPLRPCLPPPLSSSPPLTRSRSQSRPRDADERARRGQASTSEGPQIQTKALIALRARIAELAMDIEGVKEMTRDMMLKAGNDADASMASAVDAGPGPGTAVGAAPSEGRSEDDIDAGEEHIQNMSLTECGGSEYSATRPSETSIQSLSTAPTPEHPSQSPPSLQPSSTAALPASSTTNLPMPIEPTPYDGEMSMELATPLEPGCTTFLPPTSPSPSASSAALTVSSPPPGTFSPPAINSLIVVMPDPVIAAPMSNALLPIPDSPALRPDDRVEREGGVISPLNIFSDVDEPVPIPIPPPKNSVADQD